MNKVTLDHIDNIILDISSPPIGNLHALNFIPQGLYLLGVTVKMEESRRVQRDGSAKVTEMFGHIPPLIPCIFHWFSTSLVNYIRLVGLIDLLNKKNWKAEDLLKPQNKSTITNNCTEYVKKIVPEIHMWRNKVSAHFAAADPFSNDNLGTLEESIMNSIIYQTPRFKVGVAKWTTEGETSQLLPWSVTETYEKLSKRYWLKSKLDYSQTLCIPPVLFSLVPDKNKPQIVR